MNNLSKKSFSFDFFFEFGTKVFKTEHFFTKSYLVYFVINILIFSLLTILEYFLILILFSSILIVLVPLKALDLKFNTPWKRKIKEHDYAFFKDFQNILLGKEVENEKTIEKCSYWYKKAKKLKFIRRPIWKMNFIIILIIYILSLLSIEIAIISLFNNERPLDISTLIIRVLINFFPLFSITSVILYIFPFSEIYINRFRMLIDDVISYNKDELRRNANKIINYFEMPKDYSELEEIIQNQFNKLMAIYNFNILEAIKDPKYNIDLRELRYKSNLVIDLYMLTLEYDPFLFRLIQNINSRFLSSKLQNNIKFIKKIQDRIEFDLINAKRFAKKRNKKFNYLFNGISQLKENKLRIPNKIKIAEAREIIVNFEKKIRKFIYEKLNKQYGEKNWWENGVPNDIRKKASKRYNKKRKLEPNISYEIIQFLDFNDYGLIIDYKKNWNEIFSKFFLERNGIIYPLKKLRDFRNDIFHSRINPEDLEKYKTHIDDVLKYIK